MTTSSGQMADRILDAAEARARRGGYGGFSFRDLAEDVGVKSASVHHHFPTKADLARRLAARYLERASAALGDPSGLSAREAGARVAGMFIDGNERDGRMCLCGVFGAESDALPDGVPELVDGFFDHLSAWLAPAFRAGGAMRPETFVAALEGGMIMARTKGRPELLREIADDLLSRL
jgi:TetR/AcrR family transcriptional repressor of nem operon